VFDVRPSLSHSIFFFYLEWKILVYEHVLLYRADRRLKSLQFFHMISCGPDYGTSTCSVATLIFDRQFATTDLRKAGIAQEWFAFHKCVPGSIPRAQCHTWVEFVVGSRLAPRVFPHPLQKPTLQIPIQPGWRIRMKTS